MNILTSESPQKDRKFKKGPCMHPKKTREMKINFTLFFSYFSLAEIVYAKYSKKLKKFIK